jgi:hypothetical protein
MTSVTSRVSISDVTVLCADSWQSTNLKLIDPMLNDKASGVMHSP